MPTTTIRLDEDLKTRTAAAAQRAGKTTHAFILDAIADTVEQAEIDAAFDHLAEQRWANLAATGKTVNWDETRDWLRARARGDTPTRPTPDDSAG